MEKIKLFNKAYSTQKSILILDSYLERDDKDFLKEIIFFEIKFYKENKKVRMLIDTHTLRGLCYALEDLVYKKESKFQKYTGGSGAKKLLSIASAEKGIFINLEDNDPSNKVKVEYIFGENGTKSFIDAMRLYADEVDKMLYKYQVQTNKIKRHG